MESSTPEGSALSLLERKKLKSTAVPTKEEIDKRREERRDDLECREAAVVIQRAYRRRLWTRRTAFVSLQSLFRGRSVRVKVNNLRHQRYEAVKCLQRFFRGPIKRRKLHLEFVLRRRERCASKLQSIVRISRHIIS